ncbi:4770_t:CDS:2, partial [Gigaspora margarita]
MHSIVEPMNIDMVVVNQTSSAQELVSTVQSTQVLKEDTSIIKKNREKPNRIYIVYDIPRDILP